MALDLKLKISTANNCTGIVIQDVTGPYHSESNPGGWGGFNINGNRSQFTLNLTIRFYILINDKVVAVTASVPYENIYYPSEDGYRGFKYSLSFNQFLFSLPLTLSSTEISQGDFDKEISKKYSSSEEFSLDGIYEVSARIISSPGGLILDTPQYRYAKSFEYKNICQTEKRVHSLLATVNLGCEDCDDSDIEKALLAKSLLTSIKAI